MNSPSLSATPVTALYAALLSVLFLVLSARVIRGRNALKIALGTAGNPAMERVTRVHANFAEYVPLTLLLLLTTEMNGTPRWLLHTAGLALLAGRCLHAWGVSQPREKFRLRITGMMLTFGTMSVLAGCLIVEAVRGV